MNLSENHNLWLYLNEFKNFPIDINIFSKYWYHYQISFFGRFGASFNQSWTQQLDTTLKELAYGVATNSSGNVYVAGMTYGESEQNSPSWSNTTSQDQSSGRSSWAHFLMKGLMESPPTPQETYMLQDTLRVD